MFPGVRALLLATLVLVVGAHPGNGSESLGSAKLNETNDWLSYSDTQVLLPSNESSGHPPTTGVTPLNTTDVTPLNTTGVTPLNTTGVTPLNTTGVTPLNTTDVTPPDASLAGLTAARPGRRDSTPLVRRKRTYGWKKLFKHKKLFPIIVGPPPCGHPMSPCGPPPPPVYYPQAECYPCQRQHHRPPPPPAHYPPPQPDYQQYQPPPPPPQQPVCHTCQQQYQPPPPPPQQPVCHTCNQPPSPVVFTHSSSYSGSQSTSYSYGGKK